ncbi:hypothetical protein GF324_07135 [bacterium]|nr:hypothetical protein [bacterium]
MRGMIAGVLLPVVAVLLTGCAGSGQVQDSATSGLERWMNEMIGSVPAEDMVFIYGYGFGESGSIQAAIGKARDNAAGMISEKIQTEMETIRRQVFEETEDGGARERFNQAVESSSHTLLQGLLEVQRDLYREGNTNHAFILMKISTTAPIQTLKDHVAEGTDVGRILEAME